MPPLLPPAIPLSPLLCQYGIIESCKCDPAKQSYNCALSQNAMNPSREYFVMGHCRAYSVSRSSTISRKFWLIDCRYDFPEGKAFVPAEVSFRPRQDIPTGWQHSPTKWQFVGTNDATCNQNSAWAILCEDLSGAGYKTNNDIKFCSVPLHLNRKYRCLGIRILQNTNVWETGLQSLRFWEKVES